MADGDSERPIRGLSRPIVARAFRRVAASLLVLAVGLAPGGAGQVLDDGRVGPTAASEAPRDGRDGREAELAELRREIARTESRLEAARQRERTLEDRLAAVELELELERRRLAEAVTARALAEQRVGDAETRVAELTAQLEEARGDLDRRVAGLYRLGGRGHLRLVLAVEPGADLTRAVRLLRYLVRRDGQAVERYRLARRDLETQRSRLETERDEATRWLGEVDARQERLAAVARQQTRLLVQAQGQRRDLAAETDALVAKEQKLATLLDVLYGGTQGPLSGRPIEEFRGVLDWPFDGRVSQGFGTRRDPRYRTQVPHNGWNIEPAEAGAVEVRAVYPGKVLYAAALEGYGPTVVVHHPGRVFTLYAGLEELRVGADDMVALGTVLGASSGPVYFEIRRQNVPEDPRDWLR